MCKHLRKQFFRHTCSNGAVQVREQCLDCGTNVRGAGVNVPHAEVVAHGRRVADLPELTAARDLDNGLSLFDALDG